MAEPASNTGSRDYYLRGIFSFKVDELRFATTHLNEATTNNETAKWHIKREETLLRLCVGRGDRRGQPYLEHCDRLLLAIRNNKEALDQMSKSLNGGFISSAIVSDLFVDMIKHFNASSSCGSRIAAHLCMRSWHSAHCILRENQAPDGLCGCPGSPPSAQAGHELDTLSEELGRATTRMQSILDQLRNK